MISKRIYLLRKLFKIYNIDGYIIPKNDEFFGEYTEKGKDRLNYISSFTGSSGPLQYTSGSVYAYPGENNNKALHTIAVYTKNFSGALRVQATMSSSPADADYFDITMDGESSPITFSSSTTVTNYNFYGVYHYIKFSWDNDTGNTGVIDKILYRR